MALNFEAPVLWHFCYIQITTPPLFAVTKFLIRLKNFPRHKNFSLNLTFLCQLLDKIMLFQFTQYTVFHKMSVTILNRSNCQISHDKS